MDSKSPFDVVAEVEGDGGLAFDRVAQAGGGLGVEAHGEGAVLDAEGGEMARPFGDDGGALDSGTGPDDLGGSGRSPVELFFRLHRHEGSFDLGLEFLLVFGDGGEGDLMGGEGGARLVEAVEFGIVHDPVAIDLGIRCRPA